MKNYVYTDVHNPEGFLFIPTESAKRMVEIQGKRYHKPLTKAQLDYIAGQLNAFAVPVSDTYYRV